VSEPSIGQMSRGEGGDPDAQDATDRFVQQLTSEQMGLFRYITALIGDPDEAGNILQETNLVLWRKASEFAAGTNFGAWARTIALWQVKASLRDRGRDRHVFSSALISQLAQHPAASADIGLRRRALRRCVESLRQNDRELLRQRYHTGGSIQEISQRLQKSPSAIKSGLFRLRKSLRMCVERRLAESA